MKVTIPIILVAFLIVVYATYYYQMKASERKFDSLRSAIFRDITNESVNDDLDR